MEIERLHAITFADLHTHKWQNSCFFPHMYDTGILENYIQNNIFSIEKWFTVCSRFIGVAYHVLCNDIYENR